MVRVASGNAPGSSPNSAMAAAWGTVMWGVLPLGMSWYVTGCNSGTNCPCAYACATRAGNA